MAVRTGAPGASTARRPPPRFGPAVLAAASAALMAGSALTRPDTPAGNGGNDGNDYVEVVEGRYAVAVPAGWTTVRVTGGPGSRRLQVTSPADPELALHITGAYAPETTLAEAAGVLGRAISAQPAGVFVDFHPGAEVAGRAAVTYREVRPGRVIDWTVVLSGATRIGVGCQSPPGREAQVRTACAQAVTTARESGTDPHR